MSLHHLDPRQTDTTPDVDLIETQWGWRAADLRDQAYSAVSRLIPGTLKTEAEALHAARVAAGFGHVAEQPCANFRAHPSAVCGDPDTCDDCAWPRRRHP